MWNNPSKDDSYHISQFALTHFNFQGWFWLFHRDRFAVCRQTFQKTLLFYLFLFSKRHFYYIEENVLSSQPGIRIYLMNHCRPNPLSWQMCLLWKFRPSPQNLTPHNLDFSISLQSIMNTKHMILVFNPELLKHQKKTLQELQNCSHWAKGFVERKDSLQWKKINLLSSISLHCFLYSMHFCTVWIVWCILCIVGSFCMYVSALPVLSSLSALCVLSDFGQ